MEDAHSFVADFAGVRGQGYFAVFDGHAGKHAAEWCGEHFHEEFIEALHSFDSQPPESDGATNADAGGAVTKDKERKTSVPDVLNKTFHAVDARLSQMADQGQTHSGCTAVTAFLRLEDDEGNQPRSFVDAAHAYQQSAPPNPLGASSSSSLSVIKEKDGPTGNIGDAAAVDGGSSSSTTGSGSKSHHHGFNNKVKSAVRSITGKSPSSEPEDITPSVSGISTTDTTSSSTPTTTPQNFTTTSTSYSTSTTTVSVFPQATRRVLYTANAGDARAVLSRGGRAVRLTYDHKGSDAQEAKRIKEAGGFVMNNRVNGAFLFFLLAFSFLFFPFLRFPSPLPFSSCSF